MRKRIASANSYNLLVQANNCWKSTKNINFNHTKIYFIAFLVKHFITSVKCILCITWSSMYEMTVLQLSSLLMLSPKPGVSTTVSRNLTPRSSISICFFSICVVRSKRSSTDGTTRFLYKSPRNNELMSVDLPSPVSPATNKVKSKPRFTDFRCTCSGNVAKPM